MMQEDQDLKTEKIVQKQARAVVPLCGSEVPPENSSGSTGWITGSTAQIERVQIDKGHYTIESRMAQPLVDSILNTEFCTGASTLP